MEWYGIDVSQWQGNNIDFNKVKAAGKKFVILRAGYGKYINQKDPTFEGNYKRAKAAGLYVGVYWYSYAKTVADAVAEAKTCLEAIKGKQYELPVYYDFEETSQFAKGKAFCSEAIKAFNQTIAAAGYLPGIYIYRAALQNYVTKEVAEMYELAVAEYASQLHYTGDVGVWQYAGDKGTCPGVSGACDLDKCYKDYPAIVKAKGLNGYKKSAKTDTDTKPAEKQETAPKKKTVEQLAKEVIEGKWSAGAERKKLLTAAGYDYTAVQKRVNEIMAAKKKKTVDEIALEVIRGDWGAGAERKKKLTAAGYDYTTVQKRVNEMIKGKK